MFTSVKSKLREFLCEFSSKYFGRDVCPSETLESILVPIIFGIIFVIGLIGNIIVILEGWKLKYSIIDWTRCIFWAVKDHQQKSPSQSKSCLRPFTGCIRHDFHSLLCPLSSLHLHIPDVVLWSLPLQILLRLTNQSRAGYFEINKNLKPRKKHDSSSQPFQKWDLS